MKLDRRAFLQALASACVAVTVPFSIETEAAPASTTAGTKLKCPGGVTVRLFDPENPSAEMRGKLIGVSTVVHRDLVTIDPMNYDGPVSQDVELRMTGVDGSYDIFDAKRVEAEIDWYGSQLGFEASISEIDHFEEVCTIRLQLHDLPWMVENKI